MERQENKAFTDRESTSRIECRHLLAKMGVRKVAAVAVFVAAVVTVLVLVFKDDRIVVACVGDSITQGNGCGLSPEMIYPAQLQRYLGDQYNVRNFGESSHTLLAGGAVRPRSRCMRRGLFLQEQGCLQKCFGFQATRGRHHAWNERREGLQLGRTAKR